MWPRLQPWGSPPPCVIDQGCPLRAKQRKQVGAQTPHLVSHNPLLLLLPHPLLLAGVLGLGLGRDNGTSLRSWSLVIMTMRGASSCHTISQKSVTVFSMGPWVAMYSRGRPA